MATIFSYQLEDIADDVEAAGIGEPLADIEVTAAAGLDKREIVLGLNRIIQHVLQSADEVVS